MSSRTPDAASGRDRTAWPTELMHTEMCATRFGMTAECDCGKELPERAFNALQHAESWRLVERYCERYPSDWRLVFKRGDEVLEVSVPEEVWRAFDR